MEMYARRLGLSEGWTFTDVMSVEDWALDMVPRPVRALLLLFPIKDAHIAHAAEQEKTAEPAADAYFMRQFVGNACGTIAIFHSVLNCAGSVPVGTLHRIRISLLFSSLLFSSLLSRPHSRTQPKGPSSTASWKPPAA